jgi:large subunit ribosomal protein L30
MYAVIRIRGTVNVRKDVEDTLKMLRLGRNMHCVVLKESDNVKGMLQKTKDWITWGIVDDKTLKHMIDKRGRKSGNKKLTAEEAGNFLNTLKETSKAPEGMKSVFRLTPPSKGFKHSVKQQYPKGELGYRGEKINELLKRMI